MFDPVLTRVLAVPALALIFKVLPIRVSPAVLIKMAFAFWFMGGASLLIAGYNRLQSAGALQSIFEPATVIGLAIAVFVGLGKGKFVLSKTSNKNIARLNALNGSQPLFEIYSLRSWILIAIMLLISASLTWFSAPLFIRGLVNIGIGLALIISSFRYLSANTTVASPAPTHPSLV